MHDLKNHLGIIETYARILRESPHISGDDLQFLEQIDIAATQARILVNGLACTSTILDEQVSCEMQPVPLRTVIEQALSLLSPVASIRNITISETVGGELWVRADREKLLEVVVNLVYFTIQSSLKKSEVAIAADSEDRHIRITIRFGENGLAAPGSCSLSDIFSRGFSERGSMGLFIACTFLNAHGAELRMEEEGEKGKSISFALLSTDPQ